MRLVGHVRRREGRPNFRYQTYTPFTLVFTYFLRPLGSSSLHQLIRSITYIFLIKDHWQTFVRSGSHLQVVIWCDYGLFLFSIVAVLFLFVTFIHQHSSPLFHGVFFSVMEGAKLAGVESGQSSLIGAADCEGMLSLSCGLFWTRKSSIQVGIVFVHVILFLHDNDFFFVCYKI